MKGYPHWFLRALIGAMLLMLATGLLLAPGTLVMRAEMDLPWRLPGGARVYTAMLHAAGGFGLAAFTGSLWSLHMRAGWRRRKHRGSGLFLGSLLVLLCMSAVAVYYLGEEQAGTIAALLHLLLGVVLLGPFGWHWLRGYRSRHHHGPAR
ncbi:MULTISPECIES: hypothetical protein [unclassified Duganella]|uniref:hypothetical protein n=1 Tax=unclassified Duganella TaxID=2636909 RepID=UPI0006F3C4E7|nr:MULTISPECIES: hypothetical protein [unclassified Duganella]KQV54004.1 hypothetical protein ASD07_05530 [Duganella sp. Root336D2]KRB98216.1 hypothetical protein ASE26_25205 [Duganella sp. Root198D2]